MTTSSAQDQPLAGHITLRYWASARSAAGLAEEQIEVDGAVTLADLIVGAVARHGGSADASRLAQVLGCCSVLVGDRPAGAVDPATVSVPPGETVEFLPPFAGG